MKAEFSEFTYGFALASELTHIFPCKTVPLFPSLRQEGASGGGYDVKILLKKGAILNLQFKLSHILSARNAREFKLISQPGLQLPYYRFDIMSGRRSNQHLLLIKLEKSNPLTFYAAPFFHRMQEINELWHSCQITNTSVFIKPSSIGVQQGSCAHRVCLDSKSFSKCRAYLFSEPQSIRIHKYGDLFELVDSQINKQDTLADSIRHHLACYSSIIEDTAESGGLVSISDTSEWPGLSQTQEKIIIQRQNLIRKLRNPPEGVGLLKLMAETSAFVGGIQALAVVQ